MRNDFIALNNQTYHVSGDLLIWKIITGPFYNGIDCEFTLMPGKYEYNVKVKKLISQSTIGSQWR